MVADCGLVDGCGLMVAGWLRVAGCGLLVEELASFITRNRQSAITNR
jgi:hypothetical protein